MSNANRTRAVLRILFCAALGAPIAAHAQRVTVIVDGGIPRYAALPAGGTTSFAFEVRNTGSATASGDVGGVLDSPVAGFAGYAFASRDPARCAAPLLEPRNGYTLVRFAVAPLDPGASLACRYDVARAAGSAGDLGFSACWLQGAFPDAFCRAYVRLGTLPDLDLAIETVAPGSGDTTILRLRLSNRSAIDVESAVASTGCHEFSGGFFEPTQFDVDGQLPGGCPVANGVLCLNFTGVTSVSRAFRLGPTPAGGSSTCLLRVRRQRAEGSAQVPLFLLGDAVALPGGALGFDPQRAGETVSIGLGLPGAVAVPVGGAAPLAIALALLLAGLHTLRRRRDGAQSA